MFTFRFPTWGGSFPLKQTKICFAKYQTMCMHLKEQSKETRWRCLPQVMRGWEGFSYKGAATDGTPRVLHMQISAGKESLKYLEKSSRVMKLCVLTVMRSSEKQFR